MGLCDRVYRSGVTCFGVTCTTIFAYHRIAIMRFYFIFLLMNEGGTLHLGRGKRLAGNKCPPRRRWHKMTRKIYTTLADHIVPIPLGLGTGTACTGSSNLLAVVIY